MLAFLWRPLRRPAPEPRRRGGHRQRLQRADALAGEEEGPGQPSLLMSKLLLRWADGALSSSALQDLAAAAVHDGWQHPMVDRLAGLRCGSWSHASLMKLLLSSSLGDAFTHCPGEEVTDLILPSRWLKILHDYPHEFRPLLGATRPGLRRFWHDFLAQPGNIWTFCKPSGDCRPDNGIA